MNCFSLFAYKMSNLMPYR